MPLTTGRLIVRSLVVLVAAGAALAGQPVPVFQGLGLGPWTNTYARRVSGDGTVVVGTNQLPFDANIRAFRWTPVGGLEYLGDLPTGVEASAAYEVNFDGSVIVGASISMSGQEACRWDHGSIIPMGDLTGGNFRSFVTAVNANGTIFAGIGWGTSAFLGAYWPTGGSSAQSMGDLTGGMAYSITTGMSADGVTAVGTSHSTSGFEACRWTLAGGMIGLGDLSGGIFESNANDISANGTTIVGDGKSASGTEACVWTGAGTPVGLGDLSGGAFASSATSVNANGTVIVGVGNTASGDHAFIWTSVDGMRDLMTVLTTQYQVDLSGWTLSSAMGVSDNGRVIVGYGNHNGHVEGWIVRLPAPCTADFNTDTLVDVADLFGYINAWLAKSAAADFNHDTLIDVADLFGYINAWLAKCN